MNAFVISVPFVLVSAAEAQTRPPRTAPRLEVGFGAGLTNGSDLGPGDAEIRAPDGGTLSLFTTSSKFAASVPIDIRLGLPLSARSTFEIRAGLSRPELETSIADDFEGAPPLSVSERVDRYVVDGGFVFGIGKRPLSGWTPFVAVGVGWVRQLHEGLALSEDGASFRGSGGLAYPFLDRGRGAIRRVGVRGEAGVIVFSKGVSVGGGAATHFTTLGSLYVAF